MLSSDKSIDVSNQVFSPEDFNATIKARTTCRVGVGSAGRFWQRVGWVGSGKEQRSAYLPPTSNLYLFMGIFLYLIGMGPKNMHCSTISSGMVEQCMQKSLVKMSMVSQYISNQLLKSLKRSGRCRQVGSENLSTTLHTLYCIYS